MSSSTDLSRQHGPGRADDRRRASVPIYRLFAFVTLVVVPAATAADSWKVQVQNGGPALGDTPVVTRIKADVPVGAYGLKAENGGVILPAQIFQDGGTRYLGVVFKAVPQGGTAYSLVAGDTNSPGVAMTRQGGGVAITVAGKPLMTHLGDASPKPYDYPVIGPTGVAITRAYPMDPNVAGEDRDHPHHRSLWFTYGDLNGIDFWASDPLAKPNKRFGSIKETAAEVVVSGPAVGILRTKDDWIGPDGRRVCTDERIVRVFEVGERRMFDYEVTLKATDGPLTFADTKEGMFGLRVASSMDAKLKNGGTITNAEGIVNDDAWGKASRWVDYTGPVAGKTVGIAILNHPESFRYPTAWHVRTYGLFAANPFGYHDFGMKTSGRHVVPAGESLTFRYRLILHEGETASADLPGAFRSYAEPPKVEITPG